MRANLPAKEYFLNKTAPGRNGYCIVEYLGSGNNALVFRARNEEFRHDLACKIIPRKNLRPGWKEEVTKPASLRSRAVVRFVQAEEWKDDQARIDCEVLYWEFVPGNSLKTFIRDHPDDVSVELAETFLSVMLDLLQEMKDQTLTHGDLHTGNVIVEDRTMSLIESPYEFRVTDFGVTSAMEEGTSRDDFDDVARILRELLALVDYQHATARDRFTFDTLNSQFLKSLTETDPTYDPFCRQPRLLYQKLRSIESDFARAVSVDAAKATFTSPFDYQSCEQIGEEHSILATLYSDRFLGLSTIEAKNNLVLTGPRGCGKSTVFKSLSLQHRIHTDTDSPESVRYCGVYYRCDDLYFAFPRYRLPQREDAYDIPLHYISATLTAALLTTIRVWAQRHWPSEMRRQEEVASRALWNTLDITPPSVPGAYTFRVLEESLHRERRRAAEKHRFANDPKHSFGTYFGPGILPSVCDILLRTFPALAGKPIVFFIDDYSSPKVTAQLQKNLNRLLMQRTSACFFKLSTESPVSYSPSDIDSKTYVEGREFELLNLGLEFMHSPRPERLAFIEDVFSRRLSAVPDYPVQTLDDLIGSDADSQSQNELARAIREGKKSATWGKEALANLCSGDVHYMIGLVSQMVSSAGGTDGLRKRDGTPRIQPDEQNRAVRNQAGSFLKNLRGIDEWGDRLVDVVTAFGNVALSLLLFKDSSNQKGAPPHQASRIEPYEPLRLAGDAQRVYQELLRYSVFIEDMRGKSRRGKVVPRLYLRRFLIPHFGLTFSMRDSLQLEANHVEELLLDPHSFERKHRLKAPQSAVPEQDSLFASGPGRSEEDEQNPEGE